MGSYADVFNMVSAAMATDNGEPAPDGYVRVRTGASRKVALVCAEPIKLEGEPGKVATEAWRLAELYCQEGPVWVEVMRTSAQHASHFVAVPAAAGAPLAVGGARPADPAGGQAAMMGALATTVESLLSANLAAHTSMVAAADRNARAETAMEALATLVDYQGRAQLAEQREAESGRGFERARELMADLFPAETRVPVLMAVAGGVAAWVQVQAAAATAAAEEAAHRRAMELRRMEMEREEVAHRRAVELARATAGGGGGGGGGGGPTA